MHRSCKVRQGQTCGKNQGETETAVNNSNPHRRSVFDPNTLSISAKPFTAGGGPRAQTPAAQGCLPREQAPVTPKTPLVTTHKHGHEHTTFIAVPVFAHRSFLCEHTLPRQLIEPSDKLLAGTGKSTTYRTYISGTDSQRYIIALQPSDITLRIQLYHANPAR